ncbi:hypothetical protein OIU34_20110 [Pararhizobium sp. BT-229]|uniref:hypothetical protein n=1 Tax=Pararhizobium sp. BT-229 TaxID=2986923 RepID=UPI0021F7D801|nr:hypothetical protein [Pararhizobium sp. BT-229]MCV9964192.1 hypothetical protein [Pararhizobium sp. BT-229]
MIIDFPVYYGIDGRLPGKRAARTYGFKEYTTVEIPEVSAHDAPVSCVWSPGPEVRVHEERVNDTNNGMFDQNGNQMTRWYGGRHWRRLLLSECPGLRFRRPGLPPIDQGSLTFLLEDKSAQKPLGVLVLGNWYPRFEAVHADPQDRFEIVKSNYRDEVLQAIARIPETVILVEGHLYRACFEPFITVSRGFRPDMRVREVVIETDIPALTRNRNLIEKVYPIGEFDQAFGLAARDAIDPLERAFVEQRRPRDVLGAAFGFDFGMLEEVTARLDEAFRVTREHTGFGDRFLREALRTVDADKRQADILKFIEFEGIRWRRLGLPIHLLEEALDLLDERPIDIEIDRSANSRLPRP